jgi:hypothetical protein
MAAQISGIDTTVPGDSSARAGWRREPRLRGIHGVALTTMVLNTLGISTDVDIIDNPLSRPRMALGVRVGFEDANTTGMIMDAYWAYTMAEMLARFTVGGGNAEFSILAGGTWISKYSAGFDSPGRYRRAILPMLGMELRWMIIPKYAGLVVRWSTVTNRLLQPPVPDLSKGETRAFTESMGGIGIIVGWEP